MNSINQQQEENNHEDLRGTDAAKKIKELSNKNTCHFITKLQETSPLHVRPMSVQVTDDDGTLWFLCANDSHIYSDIKADSRVHLLFQGSSYSDFLSLGATAKLTADKAKIKELWEPTLKTWFTEGQDDPRIAVIEVTPLEGYYWDNKHGNAVAFLKTVAGAIVGKTMDDSIEGKLNSITN